MAALRNGLLALLRYRVGASDVDTCVCEREWSSMAAFEDGWEKAFADSEHQALVGELGSSALSTQFELYLVQ